MYESDTHDKIWLPFLSATHEWELKMIDITNSRGVFNFNKTSAESMLNPTSCYSQIYQQTSRVRIRYTDIELQIRSITIYKKPYKLSENVRRNMTIDSDRKHDYNIGFDFYITLFWSTNNIIIN